jgi:hypothetical protein
MSTIFNGSENWRPTSGDLTILLERTGKSEGGKVRIIDSRSTESLDRLK